MNKLVTKKSLLKNSNNYYNSPPEKKQKKKEKCLCPPITKTTKNSKRTMRKLKKVVRNINLLNEWAENESSRPEIYEKPEFVTNLKKNLSSESLIYIGSYQNLQKKNPSVIDLTQCSSESHEDISLGSKPLKTIYFPSKNFDRSFKLKKSMATTSLITLPVMKRDKIPKKVNSTTVLNTTTKEKLSLLDIPEEYMDASNFNEDFSAFQRARLTSSDYRMIDWILDVEEDFDCPLSPCTSGYNTSLDTDTSIGEMCSMYNVNFKDNI